MQKPVKPRGAPLRELGRIGQNKYAGVFFEEFQPDLRGKNGVEVYREMAENDDIVGAMLFAIEMLIRQVAFDVEPAGTGTGDRRAAAFVKENLHDMRQTWQETLSEMLSFIPYGWAFHEICYKRRLGRRADPEASSRYSDGLIGWAKLPIRAQDTLVRWQYDERDRLLGMVQLAMGDSAERFIPSSKAIHLMTKSRKWNPEGRSVLRNAYRSWYFKKRLQEIEGIGVERDLAGLPVLQPPEGIDLWDAQDPMAVQQLRAAQQLVQNVRRDALEGVVLPGGWTFSLMSGGSKRQFEVGSIIERYDKRIAMTVMADFILLGSGNVGSFALSSDKTHLFSVALGAFMDIICEGFNSQAIPALIELNRQAFAGITDYPRLVHGDVEKPDLNEMSAFIERMTGVGLIAPDANLETYVRRLGGLPEALPPHPPKEDVQ